MREDLIELTTRLVAIPTHGGRELDAQLLLKRELETAGFACTLQEVAVGRPNLIARRGTGGPFLCTHVDTQPPFEHPDPYTCKQEDGLLVGRGVLDTKGQIAAIVQAARQTTQPVTIVVTVDEEAAGTGSLLLEIDPKPRTGVVIEPTDFHVGTAQAGNIEVRLEVRTDAVHMAEADRAKTALQRADELLKRLAALPFMRATHRLFPRPWYHVGKITAGEHLWRTPARATVDASSAILPGVDPHEVLDQVTTALDGEHFEIPDVTEPYEFRGESPIRGHAEAGMRSWTDAAFLWHVHGIPCVVFGAGDLAPAHSDREWVRVDDLVRLTGTLTSLIREP